MALLLLELLETSFSSEGKLISAKRILTGSATVNESLHLYSASLLSEILCAYEISQ